MDNVLYLLDKRKIAQDMAKPSLTSTGLEAIKKDAVLFAEVANELRIEPASLARSIERKAKSLAAKSVVRLIHERTGIDTDKLLQTA